MQNIKNILDSIVATYQDIPDLVAAMDGEKEAIYSFMIDRPTSPNYEDILDKLPWPGMLITHSNTELGYRGNITHFRHTIRVDIKLTDISDYYTVMKLLVDGIPETSDDQLPLMSCSFTDVVDPMEAVVFTRQIDPNGKNYYRMEYALQEKL